MEYATDQLNISSMFVYKKYAFVIGSSFGGSNLKVVRLKPYHAPRKVNTFDVPDSGHLNSVFVKDSRVYMSDGMHGLRVVDFRCPR